MFVEWVWTLIATVGLFYAARNLIEARRDMKAVESTGNNGGRRILARAIFRAELGRCLVQVFFVALGVIVLTYTIPPRWFIDFFQWGLVTASALIALNSVDGNRTRQRLRRYLERQEEP